HGDGAPLDRGNDLALVEAVEAGVAERTDGTLAQARTQRLRGIVQHEGAVLAADGFPRAEVVRDAVETGSDHGQCPREIAAAEGGRIEPERAGINVAQARPQAGPFDR